MFENIKKEDKIRYATIGMIVLFILSTIAIYISSSSRAGGGATGSTQGMQNEPNTTYSFVGKGEANATLISWDPAIFVKGQDESLEAMLEKLKDMRVVINDVPQAGGHIIRLADSSLVFSVSRMLSSLNVTIIGSGTISIPQAIVRGNGIERVVSGGTYPYQGRPDFDQGESFPVVFDAYVEGNAMPYIPQNIIVLAGQPTDAEIKPINVSIIQPYLKASLPWELRRTDITQFQLNLIGGDKVRFKQRSIVLFNDTLTDSQIEKLRAANFNWSTGDIESGLMGVNPEFEDKKQIESDLMPMGIKPLFPVSTIEVYPYMGAMPGSGENRSFEQAMKDTWEIWNQTFPEISINFTPAYKLNVILPREINASDGQAYRLLKTEYNISSTYPPLENGTLKITFVPRGRQVDSIISAFYSPVGEIVPIETS
jgi:hypothetical protein